jgi:hypothetical protein
VKPSLRVFDFAKLAAISLAPSGKPLNRSLVCKIIIGFSQNIFAIRQFDFG